MAVFLKNHQNLLLHESVLWYESNSLTRGRFVIRRSKWSKESTIDQQQPLIIPAEIITFPKTHRRLHRRSGSAKEICGEDQDNRTWMDEY